MRLIRLSAVLVAIASAIALAACGGDTTTVVTTSPTGSAATSTSGESYDINADIADQMAVTGGGRSLATICQQLAKGYPREVALQMGVKQLGAVIIKQGGSPTEVVNLLLDRC